MNENCNYFKFRDVTQTLHRYTDIRPKSAFNSNYYQTASFFIPGGHFNRKKNNDDFWAVDRFSNVVCEVSC